MNVLTTTWRQLVRRRLWPVALLLLAALAAVPVVLARDPKPVVPSSPVEAPAESTKVDDALAEPVVAKASTADRSRRRRVIGARKNPFTPDSVKHPPKKKHKASKKKAAADTTPASSDTPSTPANTGGSTVPSPSVPTTPVTPVEPAPKKKTYPKGSVIVRFGDATSDSLTRTVVKKLGALPDDNDPVLVYMGTTDHGKKAVFLVDDALQPTGDGDCKPHPSNCETVELAQGETEFFDVIDPESGQITAQFELDVVDIK